MAHAHAGLSRLELDVKRIAGTTVAIALHLGVLMMLLAPAHTPSSMQAADEVVLNWLDPPIVTLPPPPLPPPAQPDRRPTPTTVRQPVPVPNPPVASVDDATSVVDYLAVPDTDASATSFDDVPAGPAFAQLSTIDAPAPPYPRPAIQRRLAGTVMLRIHVDAAGRPIQVSIESSSGHAILDQAALKVVKARWRFVPATQDGAAVAAWALVPIEFVLQ